MRQKTIVILGGGMGGIVTARDLRKHIGHEHRIIVIDKLSYHAFQPSFLWVAIGWRTPAVIIKQFSALAKYGIEFLQTEVISIDTENQQVNTTEDCIDFDYLVIALGAENVFKYEKKDKKNLHTFYTFEGAVELSKIISTFSGGNIVINQTARDIKYPFAPFDSAFLLSSFYQKRGIKNVNITIISPNDKPLPFISLEQNLHLRNLLNDHNIQFRSVKNNSDSNFDCDSDVIPFEKTNDQNLIIQIPQLKPPGIIGSPELVDSTGWIKVDKRTLQTFTPNIYAIGDCNGMKLENDSLLPKAGIFANKQAEVVAYNIAQELQGHSERKEFSGYGFFFIETGNGRALYLHGNLTAEPIQPLSWIEPNVTLHWSKVVLEKYWLWRWL
jgi:sulfide:quinone oxidoreductase